MRSWFLNPDPPSTMDWGPPPSQQGLPPPTGTLYFASGDRLTGDWAADRVEHGAFLEDPRDGAYIHCIWYVYSIYTQCMYIPILCFVFMPSPFFNLISHTFILRPT